MKASMVTDFEKIRGKKDYGAKASIGGEETKITLICETTRRNIATEMKENTARLFGDWSKVEKELVKYSKELLVRTNYMKTSETLKPKDLAISLVIISANDEFGDSFDIFAEIPRYLPEGYQAVYSNNFDFCDRNIELNSDG